MAVSPSVYNIQKVYTFSAGLYINDIMIERNEIWIIYPL